MDKSMTMSERKHSDREFSNEDTVRRRAWIEWALDSVKGRFSVGEERIEFQNKATKPHLFLVDSNCSR
jgi:hypothetical protein